MKKKNAVIALAVTAALTVPFSVFAATSDTTTARNIRGFFGVDTSKLTDQQKADVNSYTSKMAELQKQFIDQMVKNGTITQAQGDAQKSKIDEEVKSGDVGSFLNGGRGFGKDGGAGCLNIDTSKLTDQQKSDLKAISKKIIELEKSNVTKAVANGLLTAAQGTNITNRLDTEAANLESSGLSTNPREYMGGFEGFMLFGKGMNGTTTLTDQQKTDLTAFVKDLAALKKDFVNQLVSDGILTKAQGDSENSRIDEMTQAQIDNGFTGGMMGKGGMMDNGMADKGGMAGFRGRGRHGGFGGDFGGDFGGGLNAPSGATSGTPGTSGTPSTPGTSGTTGTSNTSASAL
ncbi:MAG TPA: DUF2680 domain-containing protein [Clostridia bacterium]|nr:DUF2680 domain-containing protein [Clostridia bacterium]